MKYVPKYLLPRIAPVSGDGGGDEVAVAKTKEFVPFKRECVRGRRGNRNRGGKKSDPLKKFGR